MGGQVFSCTERSAIELDCLLRTAVAVHVKVAADFKHTAVLHRKSAVARPVKTRTFIFSLEISARLQIPSIYDNLLLSAFIHNGFCEIEPAAGVYADHACLPVGCATLVCASDTRLARNVHDASVVDDECAVPFVRRAVAIGGSTHIQHAGNGQRSAGHMDDAGTGGTFGRFRTADPEVSLERHRSTGRDRDRVGSGLAKPDVHIIVRFLRIRRTCSERYAPAIDHLKARS